MNLLENYLSGLDSPFSVFNRTTALSLYKPRNPFAHKGDFGHALLLAGSYGKIGAAVLAARACLSAGVGLLTVHLPSCGYEIMQTALPEAMVQADNNQFLISSLPNDLDAYKAAGMGPGIGTDQVTLLMFKKFLKAFQKPLILDADALNMMSNSPELLRWLKPETIITPHPKEFDRLFGSSADELTRFGKAKKMAIQYQLIIVLKGHFTGIFTPDGDISFNTSGNAGMAKGGSGDALTGIITALMAQSYTASSAAALGVFLHGCAGDLAAEIYSEEAMLATNLIHCLGKTFLEWKGLKKDRTDIP